MIDRRPATVHLQGVSKRYARGRQVLTEVDLEVFPGDILAVTGGNGSGKSTLLRILAGLSLPSSGRLVRTGRVIGYVPERFPSHDRMSALSYLRHMGRIRGLTADAAEERARHLLERLALAGGSGTAMRKLSKGNAQKVALAQALLVPPDLLVLDEPWSGLDISVHGTLGDLMSETALHGGAVIFTDHRESVVQARAAKVCRIDRGRLTGPTAPPAGAPVRPAAGPALMKVDLTPAPGRTSPPANLDWRGLPGVVGADPRDNGVELTVSRESHDALLVEAITHGWSVAGVHPAAEPAPHTPGTPR